MLIFKKQKSCDNHKMMMEKLKCVISPILIWNMLIFILMDIEKHHDDAWQKLNANS